MGQNKWEPDDFLEEFLDFDYRKPVPDQREGSAKGLPADKVTQPKQEKNNHGFRDNYDLYENLRHGNDRSAGEQATAPAEAGNLRSSDALRTKNSGAVAGNLDIPEPLSRRKAVSGPVSAAPAVKPRPAESSGAGSSQTKPVQEKSSETKKSQAKPKKKGLFNRGKATELASGALGAAKKFVASDEDQAPEEIPSAAASINEIEGIGKISAVHDPYVASGNRNNPVQNGHSSQTGEKDELAALFAELGEPTGDSVMSSEENAALAQAQHDAYDRYRDNYVKGIRKRMGSGKAGWFPRWLSRIYVLALAVFAVVITVLNVLPFGMLIAFFVVLGLLSIIILVQLRKDNIRKWTRVLASLTALVLIVFFGFGTAYAMGTLSFLDSTSVQNENRVASVTREPFNVCITGIDVDGKIDEQGRSDVNMIVTVNPKTEQILMTSIPRDYQIYMPDKDNAMDKLTHTGFYSVGTTIAAEEQLLDTKINYYVKVNFTTVKKFIDAIGGIDVYSEYEFTPVKMKKWTVQKGWNHMNGKQALAFARERKAFIDGDNQRIKNQQAVFEAIIKKAMSSKTMVLSYNKILSNLAPYFQMSFSSGELRSLVKLQLAKDPKWKIFKNTIVGGNGSLPTYTTGNAYAYVMTQDEYSIDNAKTLINGVLEGKMLEKDDDNDVHVVEEGAEGAEDGESGDPEGE